VAISQLHDCGWCSETYHEKDSDAHDRRKYCSRDCELKDEGTSANPDYRS